MNPVIEVYELHGDLTVIVGDFNLLHINWKNWSTGSGSPSSLSFQFIECLSMLGDCYFNQHIFKATRGRGHNNRRLLDLIITPNDTTIDNLEFCSPLGKSDHSVLQFSIVCEFTLTPHTKERTYFDKADYDLINSKLSLIDWTPLLRPELDLDTQWNNFKMCINNIIKLYAPTSNVIVNKARKGTIPHDKTICAQIKRKNRLWTRYIEVRSDDKYRKYCKARNKVRKLTQSARKVYETNIASKAKSNPKAIWQYINKNPKNVVGIPCIPDSQKSAAGNEIATSDQDKADLLAEFFSSVFTKETALNLPLLHNHSSLTEMPPLEILENDILDYFSKIKITTSPGPDGFHPKFIKETISHLLHPLSTLFSRSLQQGIVPLDWKLGNISPIHKKGKKNIPENYRPINLTSIISKCMEKIIKT